ncbi:MAG: hypothetical protein ABIX01_01220 [Chitinophagaceae bacterium]
MNVGIEFIRRVNMVELKSKLPKDEQMHFQMFSGEGKMVFSKTTLNIHAGSNVKEKLEISHLPAGIYTLKVSVGQPPLHFETLTITI